MKQSHLKYLSCPKCSGDLIIHEIENSVGDTIQEGQLKCSDCETVYDIIRSIPRFVPMENYASGFGLEWNKHARTQYDSHTGTQISETRFFEETKWPRKLKGETILEVGSGSGRFTEQAASTGAMVVSMDYSTAVEANYESNGQKDDVLIVQGDIYSMPFKTNFFDKVFCFGVLQHTPDPRKAFLSLSKFLKPGGSLATDIYSHKRYILATRYCAWMITKRLPHETLYKLVEKYVSFMWPVVKLVNKLPKGRNINRVLFLISDYIGYYPLSDELLKEWAILDTFDALSPAYDKPQSLNTMKKWFREAGLENIEVRYGYNGIEGRGSKAL